MNRDTEGYEEDSEANRAIAEKQKIFSLFVELGAEIFSQPGIEQIQNNPDSITTESLKDSFNKHPDTAKECLGEVNNNAGEDNHE